MNSIQRFQNNYLSMSLVPRETLLAVLNDVALEQQRNLDRLSLAIPVDKTNSYYESQLMRRFND